jgi:membrane-associated phospholipid phosphatase
MHLFDSDLYRAVVAFAAGTDWLHLPAEVFTDYGFGLFVVLWGLAFRKADRTALFWAPFAVGFAYLVSRGVKLLVAEVRPCRTLAPVTTVLPCDLPTDYSFPSNHATIAGAAATALLIIDRRLGIVASVIALLIGFSRVYLGAHYPHDVLAGFGVGAVVALVGYLVISRWVAARPEP